MVLRRVLSLQVLLLLLPLLCFQQGCRGLEFRNWTLPDKPGWSMSTAVNITGWRGRSAVLPCTFTYPPPAYQGHILVIWYKDATDNVCFECSFPNSTHGMSTLVQCLTGNDQYRLVGDPRQNNISLEIRSLALNENGKNYYCRVELTEREGANWGTHYATELLVNAPAIILTLNITGNNTVECVAEGNPKPNITWTSGDGGVFSVSPDSGGGPTEPYTQRSKIIVTQNGTFTCVAKNTHGSDHKEVGEKPPTVATVAKFPVLEVVIPVLILLLLGFLLGLSLLCWKRKGSSCQTFPNRKARDIAIFTNEEVKEMELVPGENPEGCTYADIVFTKKPKQATLEQASSDSPNNGGDVTYAVVAVRKKNENQPL